jgi:hypothetical protein
MFLALLFNFILNLIFKMVQITIIYFQIDYFLSNLIKINILYKMLLV